MAELRKVSLITHRYLSNICHKYLAALEHYEFQKDEGNKKDLDSAYTNLERMISKEMVAERFRLKRKIRQLSAQVHGPKEKDTKPRQESTYGPSEKGSAICESGSVASGGNRTYCTCDICF